MVSLKWLVIGLSILSVLTGWTLAQNESEDRSNSFNEKKFKMQVEMENQGTVVKAIGERAHIGNCKDEWNSNGVCQRIFNRKYKNLEEYDFVEKYVWSCHENFIGDYCDQWEPNFFGYDWKSWPLVDGKIWSGNGIWDDGITGTGTWYWNSPELQSVNFCKKVILDAGHHQENEVKSLGLTFLFFLLLAWIILIHV